MSQLAASRAVHVFLLTTVAALLYLPNLGGPSLWDIDEPNNSECARSMMEANNWVVPTFNATLRVDKPALLYWLQILSYRLLGVSEFAARLPSALASLGAVLLTYFLGRRLFDAATGLLAGLILASATLFSAAAHFANPDALLNLCTLAYLACFWMAYERQQMLWFLPGGVAAGLGMLAKGPVGIVLPMGVIILFLLWSRRLGFLFNRYLLLAGFLCVLVFAPWYAWVGIETKAEFLRGFFLKHNLDRALAPMEGHHGRWFAYYPMVLLAGLAPWSAFLGLTCWQGTGQRAQADGEKTARYRFLWCWIAIYLVFFSFSRTKLPNYILPVYVPFALLTARALERWRQGLRDVGWLLRGGVVCFGLIGLFLGVGMLVASGGLAVPALRGPRIPGLEPWALLGVLLVLGALVAGWCVWKEQRTRALMALTTTAILLLTGVATGGVTVVDRTKAPRPLVQTLLETQTDPEIRVLTYRYFQPSLVFYVQRQVWQVQEEKDLLEQLRYPMEVYAFLPASEWERLQEKSPLPYRLLGQHRDLYRQCDVVLVTNR